MTCLITVIIIDELRKVKDHKYGNENPNVTGGWDGIIGELVRRVSPNVPHKLRKGCKRLLWEMAAYVSWSNGR